MKKVWAILMILALAAALVWVGYRYVFKKQMTEEAVLYTAPIEENLTTELTKTEDDGGTADFVELEKSAEGL